MTVEISNRHWVHFKHPKATYEYRARMVELVGLQIQFEVERRELLPNGEFSPWYGVDMHNAGRKTAW